VCSVVREAVEAVVTDMSVDVFFRIPISHRTKADDSLLAKAFYRPEKKYGDPYFQIEDKVGVRIVVLSSEDNRTVEAAIVSQTDVWVAEKARDYECERAAKPFEFDYQSLHYVVRLVSTRDVDGVVIPAGIPCEIQIRTLLQHAYSELTHDTIYKPSVAAKPDVKRAAAKSMALIEATDDYFTEVRAKIQAEIAPAQRIDAATRAEYVHSVGLNPDATSLNEIIIDFYKVFSSNNIEAELAEFLKAKAFVADRVREQATTSLLFRQPAILLFYLAVAKRRRDAARNSPLSLVELAPIYSDLGIASPQ
jgi:putative GTP pyrophosphokinase